MTTQEIIDGLTNILNYCRYHENAPALREAIRILTEMLKTEDAPDTNVDTISRKAAIRIASGYCHPANVAKELAKLPFTQQENIYCKECSRYSNGYCHHPETYGMYVDVNHFCGYAERREDEQ